MHRTSNDLTEMTVLDSPLLREEALERSRESIKRLRAILARPLCVTEKVLACHAISLNRHVPKRGHDECLFSVDRVAMQDATAQMAMLQLMSSGKDRTVVPATIHCDHFVVAEQGSNADIRLALRDNGEIYAFLRDAAAFYGMGFWEPGSGIIHQVVLEEYALPGMLLVGSDSHTPNAGGLGVLGIGVGGAEALDALTLGTLSMPWPKIIGVHLTGKLGRWASPKDVILKVAQYLGSSGGKGAVLEYFGTGVESLSVTGRATICNMSAELGATSSVFPYDVRGHRYLVATERALAARAANRVTSERHLASDVGVALDPYAVFDDVLQVDLDAVEPLVAGPDRPDRVRAASEWRSEARIERWPLEISQCLVGSCTNSSYEDLLRAASIARQAAEAGLRVKAPLLVTPGSERVRSVLERDGALSQLEQIGGKILANACGPCIGQWKRDDVEAGRQNVILSSYNRNFRGRNDGNTETLAFLASPEVVVAYALAGTLDFDPEREGVQGARLMPDNRREVPADEFVSSRKGFRSPPEHALRVPVKIDPVSDRLSRIETMPVWAPEDFQGLAVLVKAVGKCTTDDIAPGGSWLKYRGHLANSCQNLFARVSNEYSRQRGRGLCPVHGVEEELADAAGHCREASVPWVVVADWNIGEGSSREHAAMEPRFTGCAAIIARSFARIYEANLKRQGILPLVFADASDYDKFRIGDRVTIENVADLEVGRTLVARRESAQGEPAAFVCAHSLSAREIDWFVAGGMLNWLRSERN